MVHNKSLSLKKKFQTLIITRTFHKYYLVVGLTLLSIIALSGQHERAHSFSQDQYQFKHLTTQEGLAHRTIHCAIVDDAGFMWFGTQDGLSKWDGQRMKNFFPIIGDSTALSGSLITDMTKDKAGNIWIVSHQGDICRLNPQTEIFTTFSYPQFANGVVLSSEMTVTIDKEGIIWIGCFDDGLVRFDPIKKTFKQFDLKEKLLTEQERFRQNSVVEIIEDVRDPNILWLAGNDGLYSFNKKTEKIDHFPSTARFAQIFD